MRQIDCPQSGNQGRREEGQVLGNVQPAKVCQSAEVQALTVNQVQQDSQHDAQGRMQSLEGVLRLGQSLSGEEKSRLRDLLLEFDDVFALDSTELGSTDVVQHRIDTGDQLPIRQPARRIPFALRQTVDELVEDMLRRGVIQPSSSPWASPVVLVNKKDGTTRFCVDYRRLNASTKMDVFPLPRVDDTLDILSNAKYFSTLDLASGYWQVKMDPASREKTAFVTHAGLYEFLVMPFGLCNAPATFQRLMETVLTGLIRKVCVDYIDDILVVGRTFDEHLENLRLVFERLRTAGLRIKPRKCHFGQKEVDYLGYTVSQDGLAPQSDKVAAVREFPIPVDLKSLRSFLGLASYYRRFIPQFSTVASPLHALTRKDVPFVWNSVCQEAFVRLKEKLTEAPLLAFPDFAKEFILETDASGLGLGAVLAQAGDDGAVRPIAYASRTLQIHEKNYGVTEMEALAVVWAVKHFRPYLYGHSCTVFTDHEALKSLLNTPHPSGKLARWGLLLQELDLHIKYRPGKANSNAGCLSRNPSSVAPDPSENREMLIATLQTGEHSAKDGEDALQLRQDNDSRLLCLKRYLLDGDLPEDEQEAKEIVLLSAQFEVLENVLYHIELDKSLRIVLPQEDRRRVFDQAHAGVFGAHLREKKMHSQLSRHYWWPRMRADISSWCRECRVCASRHVGKQVRPPLTPIPVSGPFDRVGVDVLQLPKTTKGNKYAIVFVDYLTKWPEVFATSDQSAITIASLLVEHIVPRHGVPTELLSDRGRAFLSKLMTEVYKLLGIHKSNTTAYHPQTDGLVERFNRTLIDMLAKTSNQNGTDWDDRLPYVLFAYRSCVQQSTGESPFFLLYGRDPRLPTDKALSLPEEGVEIDLEDYRSDLVRRMSEAWGLAQESVQKAQKSQKKFHD